MFFLVKRDYILERINALGFFTYWGAPHFAFFIRFLSDFGILLEESGLYKRFIRIIDGIGSYEIYFRMLWYCLCSR